VLSVGRLLTRRWGLPDSHLQVTPLPYLRRRVKPRRSPPLIVSRSPRILPICWQGETGRDLSRVKIEPLPRLCTGARTRSVRFRPISPRRTEVDCRLGSGSSSPPDVCRDHYHVVATRSRCSHDGCGKELSRRVIGTEPSLTCFLIKVDALGLPYVAFRASASGRERVIAIGNPSAWKAP